MRPPTIPIRRSGLTPPSAWRGPAAQVQRPPPKPPIVRKPCGFCNRVRAWVGIGPRS